MSRLHRPSPLELALVCLSALALASQSGAKLAIVNESPSLPKGRYLRRWTGMPGVSDIVALVPPAHVQAYLRQIGMPRDVLLLKRIAAVEDEVVCAGERSVVTPRAKVTVRQRDGGGRRLPAWRDCRRLEKGQVFLLGDSPDSFDSRYFGPVDRADLTASFVEVLRW